MYAKNPYSVNSHVGNTKQCKNAVLLTPLFEVASNRRYVYQDLRNLTRNIFEIDPSPTIDIHEQSLTEYSS